MVRLRSTIVARTSQTTVIVVDSHIQVWDTPGLGVSFNVQEAKKHLRDEDKGFFD